MYCAVSGLFSDCIRVLGYARLKAHSVFEDLGVDCPTSTLARNIGEMKQRLTQFGSSRPFGASVLYVGIEDNEYRMFSTDPSGTVNRWIGKCYGESEDSINSMMKKEFSNGLCTFEETKKKIFQILSSSKEFGEKEAETVELLHFKKEGSVYSSLDEIKLALKNINKESKEESKWTLYTIFWLVISFFQNITGQKIL